MIGAVFTDGLEVQFINGVNCEYKSDSNMFVITMSSGNRVMVPRENVMYIGIAKETEEGDFIYE